MNCPECGKKMRIETVESYPYKASGLPNIVLAGVTQRVCGSCGEREIVIPRLEELHRAIARAIITKRARLMPDEVRFLRKSIGCSGIDFAKLLAVTPETVSRWENGKETIGPSSDRLIRMVAANTAPKTDYSNDELAKIEDEAKPVKIRLKPGRTQGWAPITA
jgi:putative zinc finger/helix-turn-helix YgiT family protein